MGRAHAYYAQKIAAGETPVFAPIDDDSFFPFFFGNERPESYAANFAQEKNFYPSLAADLQPADRERYASSVESNKHLIARRLRELEDEMRWLGTLSAANSTLPEKLISGTLHEA